MTESEKFLFNAEQSRIELGMMYPHRVNLTGVDLGSTERIMENIISQARQLGKQRSCKEMLKYQISKFEGDITKIDQFT